MQKYRVSLNDLPPEGQEFIVDEPAVWQAPLREFHMDCRVVEPLRARIAVLPVDNGWLVRGTLTGAVIVPCCRCAEDALVPVSTRFEDFEAPFGQDEGDAEAARHDDVVPPDETDNERIVYDGNAPLLDLAAVCWEEFVLALPSTPLCREDCKGLCAGCGANLNEGLCACPADEGDPRMAALRGLILHKN